MDTVPLYVDWRACPTTPLSGLSWLTVLYGFPQAFLISKETPAAGWRYEKERHSAELGVSKLHLVQGRVPPSSPPCSPQCTCPRRDNRGQLQLHLALPTAPAPLHPHTPHGWNVWFSGFSAKSEDGLYLEVQKCCSWIRTAFMTMYEFEWKW